MISLRRELMRSYLQYLLMDVAVVPLDDFEIKTLSRKYKFVVGEETRVPRWLAIILEKKGKVKISDEIDVKKILGRLPYYLVREKEKAPIEIESDLYFRAKEYLEKIKSEQERKRLQEILSRFIKLRVPRILRKALIKGGEENILLWEDVLVRYIRRIHDSWLRAFFEESLLDILSMLEGEF